MAKDLNRVMLIGCLGPDPELRSTQEGAPMAAFRLAAARQWRDGEGNTREEPEGFAVVAWNRLAELCSGRLHTGARAYIEGRLQNRSWDDAQTGEKRYRTTIIAGDMLILESRSGGLADGDGWGAERGMAGARPSRAARGPRRADEPGGDEDIPF